MIATPRVLCATALLVLSGAPALAQTPAPRPFAFSVGAGTDYWSKGLSKTDGEAYVFGTADWRSGPVYAGVAAATVDIPIGASWETDAKIGVRSKIVGWDTDFAVFYRAFQDANPGTDDDYVEFRAQVSRGFGPLNVRLLTWQTPDNVGPPEAANWSEGRLTWRAGPKVRASVSLGHHDQDKGPTYTAWNAGVGIDVAPQVELDLRWYDTDAHAFGSRYEGEAVAALVTRF